MARSRAHRTSTFEAAARPSALGRRLLAAVLSATLVLSGVPAQALAEAALATGADQGAGVATAVEADGRGAVTNAGEAGRDDEAATAGAGQDDAAGDADADAAAPTGSSAAAPSGAKPRRAPSGQTSFSSYDDVYIESSADATGGYDVTGTVAVGTTLYAHVYDYSEEERIEPDGSWTYQWYALNSQHGSVSDSAKIEGATSASYAPTAAQANKYLRVTVTCASASVTSSGVGPVKAPLPAGAVTLYDVTVQGTAAVGSTITATARAGSSYSTATEVSAGTKVTYTWRTSDEEPTYSGTVWKTVATDVRDGSAPSTFVVTDACRGKWVSVTAAAGDNTVEPSYYSAVGPVLGEGDARLYAVRIDNTEPAVGDTLTATAYKSYSSPVDASTRVTFTWYAGDRQVKSGSGAGAATLAVTDVMAGAVVRVEASAGVNSESASTSAVLARGATRLYAVTVDDPGTPEVGQTLTAHATRGSYSSQTEVTEGVSYQWRYRRGTSGDWADIPGATLATYTVPASLPDGQGAEGAYLSVTACAGANTVALSDYRAVGPLRLAGAVEISTAYLAASEDSTSAVSKLRAGATYWAQAREKGASSRTTVDPDKLTYQWQVSDDRRAWDDVAGATGRSFTPDASYAGRYLRCHVAARVGESSYDTNPRSNAVAAADALDVTRVTTDAAESPQVGDIVRATAYASDADVTSDARVSWQWYQSATASGAGTPIEGATGPTLTLGDAQLGAFVYASADGTGGAWAAVTSSKAGKVSMPGAVTLYRVDVSGAPSVGAWQALAATAYVRDDSGSYTRTVEAPAGSAISWQWQYATRKTTDDAAFEDIPGATSRTLDLSSATVGGVDLTGTYLRVRATSDNEVVSTSAPGSYGYGTRDVDPVGPVTLKGLYTLSAVGLSSSGQGAQAGCTLTPQAKVRGSYGYDDDAPSDASLSFAWEVSADGRGGWEPLDVGVGQDGTLTLSDRLRGSYVRVSACALDNTVWSDPVRVLGADEYDLLRVTTSPQIGSSTARLFTGDEVSATVYARRLSGSSYGDDVTGRAGVGVQWYAGDSPKGPWQPIEGATSATLTIPSGAAGKYLRCVATSASGSVELAGVGSVIDASTLEGALARLDEQAWAPAPVFGRDTNLNALVEAKLAELGVEGATVTTTAATRAGSVPAAARLGVSTGPDDNGDVTFFFMDPDAYSGWGASYATWRRMTVSFSVSAGGRSVAWTPSRGVSVDFDRSAYEELLESRAQALAVGYAIGDSADSVTQGLTLPWRLPGADGRAASWSEVVWESSGDAVRVSGDGWGDYTGTPSRGGADRKATLTATVGFSSSDLPDVSVTRDFEVTVKGDPAKVEGERASLAEKLENGFSYDRVRDFATGGGVDHDAVVGDLQLPRPRDLGVDGKYYEVSYAADGRSIATNGYHAEVVRPLGSDATVALTCTVTDKGNPEIRASKTLTFTVRAVDEGEIDAEVALLERVEAAYKDALLGSGTDAAQQEPARSDLATFQKAYLDGTGALVFARSVAEAQGHEGIVPADLPGYDPMGPYDQARLFASDDTDVVLNETLQLAWNADRSTSLSLWHEQPVRNTRVRVGSRLRSERFGAYYARYKDDASVPASLLDKLRRLAGEDVSATIDVAGTSGEEPAVPQLRASVAVVGTDAFGRAETWVGATTSSFDEGTTALAATSRTLDALGVAHEGPAAGSAGLGSVTSPLDGRALADGPGASWRLYVNGAEVAGDAGSHALSEGDALVWRYVAAGAAEPSRDVLTATVSVVGPGADGASVSWVGLTELSVPVGTTAAGLTRQALARAGMTCDERGGIMESVSAASGTLPNGAATLSNVERADGTWDYWQFYVNGTFMDRYAANYQVRPGDHVQWVYGSEGTLLPRSEVDLRPDATRPGYTAPWPGYRGEGQSGTSGASTPTEGSRLVWQQELQGGSGLKRVGDPVIVRDGDGADRLYVAVGDELQVRDASTGAVVRRARLAGTVDTTCRPVYTEGLVVVPLHGGRLQALTADTLETTWLTEALPASSGTQQQSISTLTTAYGHVYFATAAPSGDATLGGWLACVSLEDGATTWRSENAGSGYWWSGLARTRGGMLVAGDDGQARLVDPATGAELARVALGAACRSSVVASPDGSAAYVVTRDGVLHRLAVGADGSLSETGRVAFASYSTSTPTLVGSLLVVGGSDASGNGLVCAVDADTLAVRSSTTRLADGGTLEAEVKSSPVVVSRDGASYAYFTCNGPTGGLYLWRVGDAAARLLFDPGTWRQYSMATVAVGADGTLYYANDSGHLFAVGAGGALPRPGRGDEPGSGGDAGRPGGSGGDAGSRVAGTPGAGVAPVAAQAAGDDGAPLALLDGMTSEVLSGLPGDGEGADDADGAVASAAVRRRDLPLWPVVGICAGGVVFVLALLRRRRDEGEEG